MIGACVIHNTMMELRMHLATACAHTVTFQYPPRRRLQPTAMCNKVTCLDTCSLCRNLPHAAADTISCNSPEYNPSAYAMQQCYREHTWYGWVCSF